MQIYRPRGYDDLVNNNVRRPCDDAPAYDPTVWEGQDTAFITRLTPHVMEEANLRSHADAAAGGVSLDDFLVSSGLVAPLRDAREEASAARLSRFHASKHSRATSLAGRIFQYWFPRVYARWQQNLTQHDLQDFSAEQLVSLMQLALRAGEMERSSMLAREISRRKMAVHLETGSSASPSAAAAQRAGSLRSSGGGGSEQGWYMGRGAEGHPSPSPMFPSQLPENAEDGRSFLPTRTPPRREWSGGGRGYAMEPAHHSVPPNDSWYQNEQAEEEEVRRRSSYEYVSSSPQRLSSLPGSRGESMRPYHGGW